MLKIQYRKYNRLNIKMNRKILTLLNGSRRFRALWIQEIRNFGRPNRTIANRGIDM
jgi:hypothetical protein